MTQLLATLCVVLVVLHQAIATCNLLYSFETSNQGWVGGDSSSYAGSASQSSTYNLAAHATQGTYALKGGYDYANGKTRAVYLVEISAGLDFSTLQYLNMDVWSSGPPKISVALSTGSSWLWHETAQMSTSNGAYSLAIDLSASIWNTGSGSNVPLANRAQVHRIAVTLFPTSNGYGEIYLDNIRICSSANENSGSSTTGSATTGSATSAAGSSTTSSTSAPTNTPIGSGFVVANGTKFSLNGCPFYVHGSNNYYMTYKGTAMTQNLLNDAQAMGHNVLRIWAFIDGGSKDGSRYSVNTQPKMFQYWDNSKGQVVYDDSADGLGNLDYVIAQAKARGIRLILVFTNNWTDFGGADQYLVWLGKGQGNHDLFWTDTAVKQVYKNWISHLVNRVNSITGVTYKNDPTIFAWELMNEPRCGGSSCLAATQIANWVDEMSTYVRSIDPNHMIGVGDEGFFNTKPGTYDQQYDGSAGAFDVYISKSAISFGTYHMYPKHWGKTNEWGLQYIQDHVNSAAAVRKPVLLEEFGTGSDESSSVRTSFYRQWVQLIESTGSAGDLYWMVASKQDDGSTYPDYDGYTLYNDNSDATAVIKTHGSVMQAKSVCTGSTTAASTTVGTQTSTQSLSTTANPSASSSSPASSASSASPASTSSASSDSSLSSVSSSSPSATSASSSPSASSASAASSASSSTSSRPSATSSQSTSSSVTPSLTTQSTSTANDGPAEASSSKLYASVMVLVVVVALCIL